QKGHAAEQIALPAKGQDALGIEVEVSYELRRAEPHARHQPARHVGKRRNFGQFRATDIDVRAQRQRVEIMPCGKRTSFHTHAAPLSFEAFVPRLDAELSGWGSGVCSNYCTGALR